MRRFLLLISLTFVFIISACGAANYDDAIGDDSDYNYEDDTPNDTIDDKFPDDSVINLNDVPELATRKIIYTVDIGIVGTDLETIYTTINSHLTANEAYIENEDITTGSYIITYRVKSDHLETFIDVLQDQGEIIHYKKTSEDITNTYSTFQSRLEALETQHERILDLMETATNLDDILELEDQRVDIESELNEIGNTLENYDSLVDYSTVNVVIDKVGNLQELLPQTDRPYVFESVIDSDEASFIFENNNEYTKDFRAVLWYDGEIIETVESTLAPYSQLEVAFDDLESNEAYVLLAFQTEEDHAESRAYRKSFETDETFVGTTGTIFGTSLSFLGTLVEYGFYAFVALLPFLIVAGLVFVPVRIYYLKKIKPRVKPRV
ncbi:MAG: DUF4349 domain-containing protein [Bacillota bacterium]